MNQKKEANSESWEKSMLRNSERSLGELGARRYRVVDPEDAGKPQGGMPDDGLSWRDSKLIRVNVLSLGRVGVFGV